jgi:hypothetical protein
MSQKIGDANHYGLSNQAAKFLFLLLGIFVTDIYA